MISLYGCDKKIVITAIFQFEPLTELFWRERKVAGSNICLSDPSQLLSQFFLVHRRDSLDTEPSAGEVLYVMVPYIIMCIAVEHLKAKGMRDLGKDTGFHDRGIGHKKITTGLVAQFSI